MLEVRKMKKHSGYLSIELIIVLAVALIMMTAGAGYYLNYLDDQAAASVAERQKQVNNAVASYLKGNYSTIATAITSTTQKYPITLATMEAAGYLPSGFSTSQNIFGQSWSVVVMEPSTSLLRALIVTTGGQAMTEKLIRKAAIKTGALGGYISGTNPTIATGTQGAWTSTLATYGVNPGSGHIASQINMSDPTQTAEYFYRTSVPGHAELNRMTTNMDMNANSITGAALITGATISGTTVNSTNSTISNNLTANAASISNGLTAGTLTSNGNVNVTNGTVNAKAVAATGAVTGSYVRGSQYTSGAACSVPGAMGYDSSGSSLVCKSGTWGSAGGIQEAYTGAWTSGNYYTLTRKSLVMLIVNKTGSCSGTGSGTYCTATCNATTGVGKYQYPMTGDYCRSSQSTSASTGGGGSTSTNCSAAASCIVPAGTYRVHATQMSAAYIE